MQLITQQKTKLSHWWKMWGPCSVGMSCVWAVQTSAGSRRELLSYILTWLLWDISMLTRQRRLFRRCRLISFLKVLHDMRFNIRVVQDSFDLMMHCRKCQRINNIIMIHAQETMKFMVISWSPAGSILWRTPKQSACQSTRVLNHTVQEYLRLCGSENK